MLLLNATDNMIDYTIFYMELWESEIFRFNAVL